MKLLSEEEQIENLLIIKEWLYDWEQASQLNNEKRLIELIKRHPEILKLREGLHGQLYVDSFKLGGRLVY
jgi:hypothetical protein